MITNEVWKPILGYEGLYEISNLKRIKSLEKRSIDGRLFKERILKSNDAIILTKDGLHKNFEIHILFMIHFKDKKPVKNKSCIYLDDVMSMRDFSAKNKINKENKTSAFTGVSLSKKTGKWLSVIMINKKNMYLGTFNNEIDAHLFYKKAVKYSYLYKGVPKLFREILKQCA